MNYKEIEMLKYILTHLMMRGVWIKNEDLKVDGKIVGVGFKPYWANPQDTKIEKLELDIADRNGRTLPFNLYHVLGYEVAAMDGRDIRSSDSVSLDIHIYSPESQSESYKKVRVELDCGTEKK